jgi:hypothetical protein
MSRILHAPALPASSPPAERPKYLARRHSLPDPALVGLSASEALLYKKQAKADFAALMLEMARLRPDGFSNYDAAELLLGDRFLEGTIRGWRNPIDQQRYPRRGERGELTRLEAYVSAERLTAFAKGT